MIRKTYIFAAAMMFCIALLAGDQIGDQQALGKLLAGSLPKGVRASILIKPQDQSIPGATYHADTARTPASTQKLLTAWAVLKAHGPAKTFPTRVASLTKDGKTYLQLDPSSSPDLFAERLWLIGQQVRAHGVSQVDGVYVDRSGTYGSGTLPGWPQGQDNKWYLPHIEGSAYGAALGTFQLFFQPGQARPRVAAFPPNDFLNINNKATQRKGKSWVRVSSKLDQAGAEIFLIEGNVSSANQAPKETISILDPNTHFTTGFCTLLTQNGVNVDNCLINGAPPKGMKHLFYEPGRPLRAMVTDMNKVSNNLFAEYLLRTLEASDGKPAASFPRAAATLEAMLRAADFPMAGLVIRDGSGLSKNNKLTATFLVALLDEALTQPDFSAEFFSSLSIGGKEGTLRKRFRQLPHGAIIRGKSGRLNQVTSLAGYICLPDKKPIAFAIFLEGRGVNTKMADQVLAKYLSKISG